MNSPIIQTYHISHKGTVRPVKAIGNIKGMVYAHESHNKGLGGFKLDIERYIGQKGEGYERRVWTPLDCMKEC